MAFIKKSPQGVLGCGIVGFSGDNNYNLDKIKGLMIWNSVERGKDATGMFSPLTGIIKSAEPAGKFFIEKEIDKLKPDTTLICHVRAKTIGVNTAENAHPFTYGDIVLVHNGTLTNYSGLNGLAAKYGWEYKDYNVDSQILAYGVSKAFEKEGELNVSILSEYEGAAALLFYNKKTDTLYAYRDKLRPLYYGYDVMGEMYISSIKEALLAFDVYVVDEFTPHTLYEIRNGTIESQKVYKSFEELNPKPVVVITNNRSRKALRREKSFKYPELKANQRGFIRKDVEPHWLVGFTLRALNTHQCSPNSSSTFGRFAKIKEDSWYKIVGYYENGSVPMMEIIDDYKSSAVLSMSMFDVDEFIPIQGDTVVFIANVESEKGNKKLWSIGDKAVVKSVDFEEAEVSIYHKDTKAVWNIPCTFLRYLKEESKIIKTLAPSTQSDLPFDTVEEFIVEDSREINPKEIEIINREEERDEDTPVDTADEFIAADIYHGFIQIITEDINELEDNYNANLDITPNINEIRSKLNISSDPAYLQSLLEISQ